jgi:two-component system cell cycle response regulator
VSVLIFDVDHFKRVNDTYGQASGDEVLKMISERVVGSIRDFDLLARYGGEEFVVIMPSTPADPAAMVAERLRRRLEADPFAVSGSAEPLPITASVGVATTNDPMETAEGLLERADQALYAAKRGGRNRVCTANVREEAMAPSEAVSAATGGA